MRSWPAWEVEDPQVLREPDYFEDRELSLIYVAKKLKEALALEKLLTDSGLDYLVEPDRYSGGVIFRAERIGAFFYVDLKDEETARITMLSGGYTPYQASA
jgi:hypothetical protein